MQEIYMKTVLQEAENANLRGEIPIGAVIVDYQSGKIIAQDGNCNIEKNDPTAHAEINVIRKACIAQNSHRLENCDIYVSLEPCPMCAQAISFARIRRVYFAAYDPKGGGVDHGAKIFQQSSCHHRPEVYGGIMEEEAGKILKNFFKNKR